MRTCEVCDTQKTTMVQVGKYFRCYECSKEPRECTECRLEKPLEDFYTLAGYKCKSCTKSYTAKEKYIMQVTMTREEALEKLSKLNIESPTYFEDKRVLTAAINRYNNENS